MLIARPHGKSNLQRCWRKKLPYMGVPRWVSAGRRAKSIDALGEDRMPNAKLHIISYNSSMTPVVQFVTDILSLGTVASDILIIFLLAIILTPLSERGWGRKVAAFFGKHAIVFSFLIATGSVIGSLFYSEFAHFAPCELCWIERGFIYTEAVILGVAIAMEKRGHTTAAAVGEFSRKTCLVLSGIDFPVSAYHTYLQLGGGAIVPCSATGPSCQFVYFIQYGYVTIPSMALTAATLVLLFMLFKQPLVKK